MFVGALLPYVWAFSRIPFLKEVGGPDNKEPRAQAAKLLFDHAHALDRALHAHCPA